MKKDDESVKIKQNPNWPYIPDHPHRILIVGGSESSKTNLLLNRKRKEKKYELKN